MKNWKTQAVATCGLLVFLVLAAGSADDEEAEKEVVSKGPAHKVSARRLWAEYDENGVAADQKYKDKIIEVTGVVDTIDKDITDTIYIKLKTGQYSSMAYCYLAAKHTNEAASLRKGQTITLRGKCDGKLMGINLRGCVLVEK